MDTFSQASSARRPSWLALVLLCFTAACGSSPATPTVAVPVAAPTPPPRPQVVIVSIDGLRPDALPAAGAVNILGLAQRGVRAVDAQTVSPSITLPSHGAMLSGYLPAVHGVTWPEYEPAKGQIRVPTVFSHARAAGLRTVMVVGKEKFAHFNLPGTVDRYRVRPSDAEVGDEAVSEIMAGFDLMLVHLPQTDLVGHAKGWMSAAYLAQVAEADRAVGHILSALGPEATVIVTADHGGYGTSHGSRRAEDMTIPWIAAGPRVPRGRTVTRVQTADTAAMALHVLGLRLPSDATGRVPADALMPEGPAPASVHRPAVAAVPASVAAPAGRGPGRSTLQRENETR